MPRKTHGLTKHPLYPHWRNMITRVTDDKSENWKNYGGRGIGVCAEWRHDPGAFIAYVESEIGPKSPKMEIDRIDNDKGYEPENIRWATKKQNVRNRSAAPRVIYNGKSVPLADMMEDCGSSVRYQAAVYRLSVGYSLKDAVTLEKARRSELCGGALKNSQKTHCAQGHPFSGNNLVFDKMGRRRCRECARLAAADRLLRLNPNKGLHQRDRTHCPQGHEYTPENTKIMGSRKTRKCRICHRAYKNKLYAAKQFRAEAC